MYDGPHNYQAFRDCTEAYFRSLIGGSGMGIRIEGGSNIVMTNNRYVQVDGATPPDQHSARFRPQGRRVGRRPADMIALGDRTRPRGGSRRSKWVRPRPSGARSPVSETLGPGKAVL